MLSGARFHDANINAGGTLEVSSGGIVVGARINSGGKLTGEFACSAVMFSSGAILDFNISAKGAPNDKVLIERLYSAIGKGVSFTLTVSGRQPDGTYLLADRATDFNETISVVNTAGTELGTLTVGGTTTIGSVNYTLNLSADSVLSVTLAGGSGGNIITGDIVSETVNVSRGMLASSANVLVSGRLNILSGGFASATTVSSGALVVSADGSAEHTRVLKGSASILGTAQLVEVSDLLFVNGYVGSAIISSGGTAEIYGLVELLSAGSNGTANVHSGGTAVSTTLSKGGDMCVREGGFASLTTIKSGGELLLSSGGTAKATTVSDGGEVRVWGGYVGTATVGSGGRIVVETGSGMLLDVASGGSVVVSEGSVNGLNLNGGDAYVKGSVNVGTIRDDGTLQLGEFGSATGLTIIGGTVLAADNAYVSGTVYNGGVISATSKTVFANVAVSSGGKLTGALQVNRGSLTFAKGGILDFDISGVAPDGDLLVTNYTLIDGTPSFTLTVSDTQAAGMYYLVDGISEFTATVTVKSQAGDKLGTITADGTKTVIGDNGYTLDLIGDTLTLEVTGGRTVITGDVSNTTVEIDGNYFASAVEINDLGTLNIVSDGKADFTMVNSGGALNVYDGGFACNTTVADGGEMTVESGLVENVLVEDGASFDMYGATGLGRALTLNGGSALVRDGRIFGGIVKGGGSLVLSNFGSAEDMDVSSGTVAVTKQGYFNGTVAKGGEVLVGSDAIFYDTTVSSGGKVSFAAAHSVDWNTLTFEDGGILNFDISGVAPDGGVLVENYAAIIGAPVCTITISDTQAAGTYKLASDTVGLYGESITVQNKAGATLAAITVEGEPVDIGDSNYTLTLNESTLTLTVAPGSWKVITGDITSEMEIIEEGFLASSVNVNTSGWLFVYSGGIASETTVNDHGMVDIASGGTAVIATVNPGGNFSVASGGTAVLIKENGGFVAVGSGAEVTFVSNTLSGIALTNAATLHSCTTANEVTISSGGNLMVSAGGTANDARVLAGGELSIKSGGVADSAVVRTGGMLMVSSGGTATNVIWTPCEGYVLAEPGTTVTYVSKYSGVYLGSNGRMVSRMDVLDAPRIGNGMEAHVMDGGLVSSGLVGYTGMAFVYDGGSFCSNTIVENGNVAVLGGIVRDTVISSGGRLTVVYDGTVTGSLTIHDGAYAVFGDGGILDFDLRRTSVSADALVNNLALVTEEPIFTLTVDSSSPLGTFKLAGGAAGFDKTLTVKNASGAGLGTLSVGQTLNVGDYGYTLDLDRTGLLSVTVTSAAPPTPTFVAKSDIDGTGISDVLFQYTGGFGQIGFWMNGTSTWQSTNATHPVDTWEVLGAYDMNANGNADSVLVGNVEVGGIKGAFVGYYVDAVDTDDNWVNISYLTNNEGYVWKNKVGNLTGNTGLNSIVWHSTELGALGAWTDGTDTWVGLGAGYDSNWTLVGCGDFDGDGKDSVLMSYMGGVKYYAVGIDGVAAALGSSDSGWVVRAIGDFKGDGKDDIVAFHKETGLVAMWGDGDPANWSQIGQLDAKDWFVVGAGDYDNDQKDDLLVRQYSSGMLGYYSGADINQWNVLGYGVDMSWTVIA